MKSYEKALAVIDDFPLNSKREFLLLAKLLRAVINSAKTHRELSKEELRKYQTIAKTEGSRMKIAGGIHKKVLSSKYPHVSFIVGVYTVELQPIFSYPIIRPLDIIPVADDFLLLQLTPSLITCAPEPPWIKRCPYGIKFTNEVQITGSVSSTKTEEAATP
eukprot:TRINITY_DN17682_c0_g1_i1.p1 TRINITY_DN17682_c0_g1~~TRINITY_DN17682_c0_g1_i1.p1  ORF type:complete len:161 (+),score=31.00 TRINITY_DN17682_c0_g1_i1:332-814(+)